LAHPCIYMRVYCVSALGTRTKSKFSKQSRLQKKLSTAFFHWSSYFCPLGNLETENWLDFLRCLATIPYLEGSVWNGFGLIIQS
jgi:hypothetical protein